MKALLIINPRAGRWVLKSWLDEAIDMLRAAGWSVTPQATERPRHATDLARTAADRGYEAVVAVGGDGTLNEVVNGAVGTPVAVGVLPVGTVNVWAREVGIPLVNVWQHLRGAARVLLNGQVQPIDVGHAAVATGAGRHFILLAGVGLDAQVAAQAAHSPDWARAMQPLEFVPPALTSALTFQGERLTITIDGTEVHREALQVVIANTALYTGFVRVATAAQLNDGRLDVCIFGGSGLPSTLRHGTQVLLGIHQADPAFEYYQGQHIEVSAPTPWPVHVDAEPCGHTPMTFTCVPGGIQMIMPPA
ncbi:MAG: diacylglycerol kinase family lipid kinase [Chloroflexi bacterium]|nr:diacylglycerol kinase family lipid kinase [Chloroflexota bacterium]MBU1750170.1 diacylglycerol kinase family lipid kinase [Chloroflexota bacterium]